MQIMQNKKGFSKKVVMIIVLVIAVVVACVGVAYKIIKQKKQLVVPQQKVQTTLVDTYKSQLPDLEKKAQENTNDPKAQHDYAVALYATGDMEKAKQAYLAEKKNNPNDSVLNNNLGNVYRDSGQYEEAIASYEKAIEFAPKEQNAYVNLAHVYQYTLNKSDLAIETYKKALKENPDNQDIKVLLANIYEQQGDKESAKALFEEVLEQNADNIAAKGGLDRLNK